MKQLHFPDISALSDYCGDGSYPRASADKIELQLRQIADFADWVEESFGDHLDLDESWNIRKQCACIRAWARTVEMNASSWLEGLTGSENEDASF